MKLLFLCTENACRSQMAEGWARALAPSDWDIVSAGTAPAELNPRAVSAMREAGVDIAHHVAKPLPADLRRWDLIVTLCGEAEEACIALDKRLPRRHWPLPDPARSPDPQAFAQVRDEIRWRVEALIEELKEPVPQVTPDVFFASDLRAGTVVDAAPFPEARKPAIKLWIDFGHLGVKQSSAQLTKRYTPESLIGTQVLAVVNFPVRQIGPFRSEVLVLGVMEAPDDVVLLRPDQPVQPGKRVG